MEAKQGSTPIYAGSRWLSKIDGKTVFVVLERKPFGVLEVKKEGLMVFGETTSKRLRQNFTPMEGRSADVPQEA